MKKIKRLFLVCALAFMLCGCYKANINITVNSDGTAKMAMEVLVSEEMLKYSGQTTKELKEGMLESMSEEEQKKVTIKEISRTYDDEKYVGFDITGDASELEKLIEVGESDVTFTMGKNEIGALAGNDLDSVTSQQMEGIEFNMNITMPGKILENNVGEVSGNTVKIDLLTFKDTEVEIKSELGGNNTMLIVGIIAAVIVIAGVAFFIIKKKKNDSSSDRTPIDPNTVITPTQTNEEKVDENKTEVVASSEEATPAEEVINEDVKEIKVDNEDPSSSENTEDEIKEDSTEN